MPMRVTTLKNGDPRRYEEWIVHEDCAPPIGCLLTGYDEVAAVQPEEADPDEDRKCVVCSKPINTL